ncbi:hypothetical protein AAII07_59300 [Microvirga sp. 0TCS3.31]
MTFPLRKSARPAPEAALGHPGVIYECLPQEKYTPGHAWAAFCSHVVIGTIHYEGNHHWVVGISKPNGGQVSTAYKNSFGTYTHALATLQEQRTKAKAPRGSSALLH